MSNIDKKLKDARKIPLVLKLAPISKSSEFSAKNFVSFTKISGGQVFQYYSLSKPSSHLQTPYTDAEVIFSREIYKKKIYSSVVLSNFFSDSSTNAFKIVDPKTTSTNFFRPQLNPSWFDRTRNSLSLLGGEFKMMFKKFSTEDNIKNTGIDLLSIQLKKAVILEQTPGGPYIPPAVVETLDVPADNIKNTKFALLSGFVKIALIKATMSAESNKNTGVMVTDITKSTSNKNDILQLNFNDINYLDESPKSISKPLNNYSTLLDNTLGYKSIRTLNSSSGIQTTVQGASFRIYPSVDFTLRYSFRMTSLLNPFTILYSDYIQVSTFKMDTSKVVVKLGSYTFTSDEQVFSINKNYSINIERKAGTFYVYVDDKLLFTKNDVLQSEILFAENTNIYLGNDFTGNSGMPGYIKNFSITKSTAILTEADKNLDYRIRPLVASELDMSGTKLTDKVSSVVWNHVGSNGSLVDSKFVLNSLNFMYTDTATDLGIYNFNNYKIEVEFALTGIPTLTSQYKTLIQKIGSSDNSSYDSSRGYSLSFVYSDLGSLVRFQIGTVTLLSNTTVNSNVKNKVEIYKTNSYIFMYINGIYDCSAENNFSLQEDPLSRLVVGRHNTDVNQAFKGELYSLKFINYYTDESQRFNTYFKANLLSYTILNFENNFELNSEENLAWYYKDRFSLITSNDKKFGDKSLLLDTIGEAIQTDANPVFNPGTGMFTFETWVKPTSYNVGATILSNNVTPSDIFNSLYERLIINSTGKLQLIIDKKFTEASSNVAIESRNTVPLNQWSHIVLEKDGSGRLKLFINGVEEAAVLAGQVLINFSTAGTVVGNNPYSKPGEGQFYGYIDSFRFLKDKALYNGNYTIPTTPVGSLDPNLIVDLSFDNQYSVADSNELLMGFDKTYRTVSAYPYVIHPETKGYPGKGYLKSLTDFNNASNAWANTSPSNSTQMVAIGYDYVNTINLVPSMKYKNNPSMHFDGDRNKTSLNFNSEITSIIKSGNFTMHFYVNLDKAKTYNDWGDNDIGTATIVSYWKNPYEGFYVEVKGLGWRALDGSEKTIYFKEPLSVNTWHEFLLTSVDGRLSIYIDGINYLLNEPVKYGDTTLTLLRHSGGFYSTAGYLNNVSFYNAGCDILSSTNIYSEGLYSDKSIYFDGIYSYSKQAEDLSTKDFTLEFQIKIFDNSNNIQSIFCNNTSPNFFMLYFDNLTNKIKVSFNSDYSAALSSTTLEKNIWYNIALIRNNSILKLYINGIKVDELPGAETIINLKRFTVGGSLSSNTAFKGLVGSVRLTPDYGLYSDSYILKGQLFDDSNDIITISLPTDSHLLNIVNNKLLNSIPSNMSLTDNSTLKLNIPSISGSSGVLIPKDKVPTLLNSNDFTLELVARISIDKTFDIVNFYNSVSNNAIIISLQATSSAESAAVVCYTSYGTESPLVSPQKIVQLDKWIRIALTKQKSIFRLYIDGIKVAEKDLPNGIRYDYNNYSGINLMGFNDGNSTDKAEIDYFYINNNKALYTGDSYPIPKTYSIYKDYSIKTEILTSDIFNTIGEESYIQNMSLDNSSYVSTTNKGISLSATKYNGNSYLINSIRTVINDFLLDIWFNPELQKSNQCLLQYMSNSSGNITISVTPEGQLSIKLISDTFGSYSMLSVENLILFNSWNSLRLILKDGLLSVSLNGKEVFKSQQDSLKTFTINSGTLYLGYNGLYSKDAYNGLIDNVTFKKYGLTSIYETIYDPLTDLFKKVNIDIKSLPIKNFNATEQLSSWIVRNGILEVKKNPISGISYFTSEAGVELFQDIILYDYNITSSSMVYLTYDIFSELSVNNYKVRLQFYNDHKVLIKEVESTTLSSLPGLNLTRYILSDVITTSAYIRIIFNIEAGLCLTNINLYIKDVSPRVLLYKSTESDLQEAVVKDYGNTVIIEEGTV